MDNFGLLFLYIIISAPCYFLACYIVLLGYKIYDMIVYSLKWNDEYITMGDVIDVVFVFDEISFLFGIVFGIAMLFMSTAVFFCFILIGLVQKIYKKLKKIYKFPNIRNIRIG